MRTRSMPTLVWLLANAIAFGCCQFSHAFVAQHKRIQQRSQSQNIRRQNENGNTYLFSKRNKKEDEDVNAGPEKSRMNDYIAQFLGKTDEPVKKKETRVTVGADDEDSSTFSHLVAIPMDACHELLIELESVQRAILYNCPILLDACIPAASTRIPLLYVQGSSGSSATSSMGVTKVLTDLVSKLSEKHLIIRVEEDEEDIDPSIDIQDLNEDGVCPFTLEFQSLEIDGDNNKVLSTVAKPNDPRTRRLQAFVHELQTTIEERYGWKSSFPHDPHPEERKSAGGFRPRIPFMELPQSMDDNLTRLRLPETEIKEEDVKFLQSDEGGNGISPIFWYQWWDDTFARKCRLREVGIYPQNSPMAGLVDNSEWSYTQFFLPHETVALPDGNEKMQQAEQKFEKYQDDRLMEAQKEMEKQQQNGGVDSSKPDGSQQPVEPDLLMTKTRERLEKVFQTSIDDMPMDGLVGEQPPSDMVGEQLPSDTTEDEEEDLDLKPVTASPDDFMEDWMKARIQKLVEEPNEESSDAAMEQVEQEFEAKPEGIDKNDTPQSGEESNVDFMDDWMKSRIRNIIENRESVKARQPIKKEKPPIEDNPVFKAYKAGELVPFPEDEGREQPKQKKRDLGPYPGSNHFVGFWRIEESPTGFSVTSNTEAASENLVLRVDGTTAGGPILDQETQQKAAGGTWKFIENKETGEVKLRIRLVIPPSKKRILEMEGIVRRISLNNEYPMASRAFGIPELEERIEQASQGDFDDVIQCDGKVFIEDAVTKKNRENIGTFSLSKISGIKDRRNYSITIPKPVRNQD